MTVAELLHGRGGGPPLSNTEFNEWAVFYQIEASEKAKAAKRR